ncbi:MAG: hypothetical protein DWQ02_03520 [Bacteroidetes bacterium]|nr:MAG: hypothetical protein DWQ02_03520 [Bacteroidota bacterium]
MKRLIIVFTLALFYLAACTNSGSHTHDGSTHTHDGTTHSHDDDSDHTHDGDEGHSHDHDGHDHDHDHDQEEFTVESDTLKQDSLKVEDN